MNRMKLIKLGNDQWVRLNDLLEWLNEMADYYRAEADRQAAEFELPEARCNRATADTFTEARNALLARSLEEQSEMSSDLSVDEGDEE